MFPKLLSSKTADLLLHEPYYCMTRTSNRNFVTSFSLALFLSLSHRVIHFTAAAWRLTFDVLDVVDNFDVIRAPCHQIAEARRQLVISQGSGDSLGISTAFETTFQLGIGVKNTHDERVSKRSFSDKNAQVIIHLRFLQNSARIPVLWSAEYRYVLLN
jgi:hypothetical protein